MDHLREQWRKIAFSLDDLRSKASFVTVQPGTSMSGWKLHIFTRDTFEVLVIYRRIQPVLDADPAMACKLATETFFENVTPEHKQYGKGVTVYLPRVATVDADIAKIVRAVGDWEVGKIQGDTHVASGVWKRYELSEPITQEIDITDGMAEYHSLYRYAGKTGNWGTWWHGSPSGDLRGSAYGLHVGTREAAREALNARIGTPAVGDWDGTREYGKTLLKGYESLGGYGTGYSTDAGPKDTYPNGKATYSDGTKIPLTVRPNIIPVEIIGPMNNTPETPYEDFKANGYMRASVTKGNAKNGYFYRNEGEDAGSISAVVPPGGAHLRRLGSRTAARGDYYRGITAHVSKDVAQRLVDALNTDRAAEAGRIVADWLAGPQDGYNDGGIGEWWANDYAKDQLLYYAQGGNLFLTEDGKYAFPSYGKPRIGVMLKGTPDGEKAYGGAQYPGSKVDVKSLEIRVLPGEYDSSHDIWLELPVGRTYTAHLASRGTYWRVHDRSRPFSKDDAWSIPLTDRGDPKWERMMAKPGYSGLDDPWHLWSYCVVIGWHGDKMVQDDEVIRFTGRPSTVDDFHPDEPMDSRQWRFEEGRGLDGEFLIIPDMSTVEKMSWGEFERMLVRTPLPQTPLGDLYQGRSFPTWESLVEKLPDRRKQGIDTGPVVDFLLDKFGMAKTAATAKSKTAAKKKVKFRDFYRGMRVEVNGHPGTVVRIHGQHNTYTRGYVTISFDYDPDRPTQYPWDEVTVIEEEA